MIAEEDEEGKKLRETLTRDVVDLHEGEVEWAAGDRVVHLGVVGLRVLSGGARVRGPRRPCRCS